MSATVAVFAIAGELDLTTAEAVAAGAREKLAAGPVLLDLRELTFMDSSGLHVLDALLRDADREGWTFALHPELQPPVRQVLELTGMIDVLPFAEVGE